MVEVDFGMDRRYVFDILTADVSFTDCILDLIDNSIDAARKDIQRNSTAEQPPTLPDDYSGYEITVSVGDDYIQIEDNCYGMEEHILAEKAFRLGARHEQAYSIGIYGVGLVRAFWKLADSGYLVTDTGGKAFHLSFSKQVVLESERPKIPASTVTSNGQKHTRLKLTNLTEDARRYFSADANIADLKREISRVFGLCIRKGLVIKFGKDTLPEFGPEIREDIPQLRQSNAFITENGVKVEIQVGVHPDYKFTGEHGHNANENRTITHEFGWYVVCNDRIVLIADRSAKVGWTEVWHSEYNGMLAWVKFTARDAERLPWDSTKTDISLEKQAQREVAPVLKAMTKIYRKANRDFRYPEAFGDENQSEPSSGKGDPSGGADDGRSDEVGNSSGSSTEPGEQRPDENGKSGKVGKGRGTKAEKAGGRGRKAGPKQPAGEHSNHVSTLLPKLHLATPNQRIKDLMDEANRIEMAEFTYAAAMLLRNLTEAVIKDYLIRSGALKTCNEAHWAAADAARAKEAPPRDPLTSKQRQDNLPTIKQILSWLSKEHGVFPDTHEKAMHRHVQDIISIWPPLNGITHETGTISDEGKLKTFRNTILPLLEFVLSEDAISG